MEFRWNHTGDFDVTTSVNRTSNRPTHREDGDSPLAQRPDQNQRSSERLVPRTESTHEHSPSNHTHPLKVVFIEHRGAVVVSVLRETP